MEKKILGNNPALPHFPYHSHCLVGGWLSTKLFEDLEDRRFQAYAYDYEKTVTEGHGRIEICECWTISDPQILRHLRGFGNWEKLQTVSRIRSQRWMGDDKTSEDRFHIASSIGAKRVLGAVRSHWGIENGLHWTLDLAFDEDRCRVRKDNGLENFAILRLIALNLLEQEQTCKRSIKGKRFLAGEKTICSRCFLVYPVSQFRCVCPGGAATGLSQERGLGSERAVKPPVHSPNSSRPRQRGEGQGVGFR